MKMQTSPLIACLIAALACAAPGFSDDPGAVPAVANAGDKPQMPNLGQATHQKINAILDQLESNGKFDVAQKDLESLFDQTIAFTPEQAFGPLRDADAALRMVTQLTEVPEASRLPLLKYLRDNEAVARELVFLIRSDKQNPAQVYELLDKLRSARGNTLNKYPTLVAALCVVRDRPLTVQINENSAEAVDPLELYDYFTANEGHLFFGLRGVPADLLIYVVDTTASVSDLKWALSHYAGDPTVGRHFFDVQYDMGNFKRGTEKTVTTKGYNLPNILRYGGVCADQAYFATSVGQAIGVPSAFTVGESGEVGHAWVGFLQAKGKQGWWNFNVGRYEEYQGIRGTVMDPQTREDIPDSYVRLLAQLIGTTADDRQVAVALFDAARRVLKLEESKAALPVDLTLSAAPVLAKPRVCTDATILALTDTGLRYCPGHRQGWFIIADMAHDGKLSLDQKKHWSDVLLKTCGPKYPEFMIAILAPMIQSIDDPKEQDRIWNAAFALVPDRLDLRAAIRMTQGDLWEKQGNLNRAGSYYEEVVNHYTNAGPFVLKALVHTEQLLRDTNKAEKVPDLYAMTWAKTTKPQSTAGVFLEQSNWYQIGKMYAERLQDAGQDAKAAAILDALDGKTASRTGTVKKGY